ncbi:MULTISPECIES: hypothetical protein [unclassified Bosea (in: a-proteobacteria)]|uniref:hypothetical protein n=1 Tax=unclassified Bosea (in: a-proteobacteria) TaxID=2653178 RepID=UPI000F75701E|nr:MULTISPECIES: hypothetical protein [unclassified Bosea (in: a-proteobacteria)]AZO78578.1 hypothetical protein BLM15_13820 [Bosea sp. Tri-49]RXT17637.1 hypothetical protein B5U98_26610 [Bosea sp. Tri-39]RXT41010.1 hypothetical protein B5U99_04480 [Bosea sp. Tri-54]
MTRAGVALALILFGATGAIAQSCEKTFTAGGEPFLTGIRYRSSGIVKVTPAKALSNLPRSISAEGFSGIRTDQASGTVTGLKDGAGTGRPQRMQVTASKAGSATVIEAVYELQSGQVADDAQVRAGLCRIIAGAAG